MCSFGSAGLCRRGNREKDIRDMMEIWRWSRERDTGFGNLTQLMGLCMMYRLRSLGMSGIRVGRAYMNHLKVKKLYYNILLCKYIQMMLVWHKKTYKLCMHPKFYKFCTLHGMVGKSLF